MQTDFPFYQNVIQQKYKGEQGTKAIGCLPPELILEIFSHLDARELERCRPVSREWCFFASDESLWKKLPLPSLAFGPQEWAKYFGECDQAPPLSRDIHQTLESPCPFWPKKKVKETHLLVLIPQSIEGTPLTLLNLEERVKKPKEGPTIKYVYPIDDLAEEHGEQPVSRSHWVLMTKDVIPGSPMTSYANQQALLTHFNKQARVDYVAPSMLEAVICLSMHYVRTRECLLGSDPQTNYAFTHCQELVEQEWQVAVGGFSPEGLEISCSMDDVDESGLAPLRIFF